MVSVRKSLLFSFAQEYSSLVISTISVMILARLLSPAEIGVYSVGAAVVGVAQVLRDFGVGNYLIQEKELTRDRIRAALGVTFVVAWTIAAMLYAVSEPAAVFYDEPRLKAVLRVLALTFLMMPFNVPVLALIRRDMSFGAYYVIHTVAALVRATTSVTLAMLGAGLMSIAWGSLAGVLATSAVAAVYRPRDARVLPGFREWRRVVSFGSQSSLSSVLGELGMSAPDLVIGKLLGFGQVGLFSRANGVYTIYQKTVVHALMPVALPAFASLYRQGHDLKVQYCRSLSYLTGVCWPFYGFLAGAALPIIHVLYGDQWHAAAPVVQLLCVAGFLTPFIHLASPLLIATGRIRSFTGIQLIVQPIRIGVVIIASLHSIEAVAAALAIPAAINGFLLHRALRSALGPVRANLWKAVRQSVALTFVTLPISVTTFIVSRGQDDNGLWLTMLAACVSMACTWIIGVIVLGHPLRDELARKFPVLEKRWFGGLAALVRAKLFK